MTQNEPQAWTRLFELAARPNQLDIRRRFAQAPDRAVLLTSVLDDFSMDLSKTSIDADVLAALLDLAQASGLDAFRARLFAGETVNVTEGRAAMHMALRAPAGSVMHQAAKAPCAEVVAALLKAGRAPRCCASARRTARARASPPLIPFSLLPNPCSPSA